MNFLKLLIVLLVVISGVFISVPRAFAQDVVLPGIIEPSVPSETIGPCQTDAQCNGNKCWNSVCVTSQVYDQLFRQQQVDDSQQKIDRLQEWLRQWQEELDRIHNL